MESDLIPLATKSDRTWSKAELRLLGTNSDLHIATRIGRTLRSVTSKREEHGIALFRVKTPRVRDRVKDAKVKLLYGPYEPPLIPGDGFLSCEIRGKVEVRNWSNAPIPWPTRGRRSLILCGDLIRAVQNESSMAVAHHWGVSCTIVSRWRTALSVPTMTEGTVCLKRHVSKENLNATPHLREYCSFVRAGRPVNYTPQGRARMLAAVRQPKSREWKRKMAKHFAKRKDKPVRPGDRVWTAKEHKLLGTLPDRKVAEMTGRTNEAVAARRIQHGIASRGRVRKLWTANEERLFGKIADDDLLGTASDPQVARQLGRALALEGMAGKRFPANAIVTT